MEEIILSIMISFLLFGFILFNYLKKRINMLLPTLFFIISYFYIMNILFEIFDWGAIVFIFIPSIILWLIDILKKS